MLLASGQIILVAYLIAVALGALFGYGRQVAAYPWLALSSLLRLIAFVATFGRVKLESRGRYLRRRSSYHTRQWRGALRRWRQERDESRSVAEGRNPGQWASIRDE